MDNHKSTSKHDKIELRSNKVRDILGEVPNKFIRWGTVIVCLFFAILIAVILCLKYPYGNGESIFEHISFMF